MSLLIPVSSKIVREAVWIAAGQAASSLAALLGIRVLTSLLTPESYGQIILLLAFSSLAVGLCQPILQATLRFYPDAAQRGKVGALRGMAQHDLILGIAAILVILLAGGALRGSFGGAKIPYAAFLILGVYVAADVYRAFESNLLNAARRQSEYSLRTILDAWVRMGLAVVAVLGLGRSCVSVLLGYAAGSSVVSAALRKWTVQGEGRPSEWRHDGWSQTVRPAFLGFALPLAPQSILSWIASVADRYILAAIAGTAAVGVYGAAYGLASYPFLAANALMISTLRPVLYDAVARGDPRKERRTIWIWLALVVLVMSAGALLLTLLAKPITFLCLGPGFRESAGLLPWIGAAYACLSVQQTCETVLFAHRQTGRVIFLQAIWAMSSSFLYVLLIPRYGARGAAIATFASFLLTALSGLLLARSHLRPGTSPD